MAGFQANGASASQLRRPSSNPPLMTRSDDWANAAGADKTRSSPPTAESQQLLERHTRALRHPQGILHGSRVTGQAGTRGVFIHHG